MARKTVANMIMSTLALRLFLRPWMQNLDSCFSSRGIFGGGDTWPNQQHIDTAAVDGELVMMPLSEQQPLTIFCTFVSQSPY